MTTTAPHHGPSWEELVTAALLGTERRVPLLTTLGREPARALLDAAAVSAVRRRAGLRPTVASTRPEVAPQDDRPPLPPAAGRRLETLLANRAGGPGGGRSRGAAPDLTELLPQWLTAANRHGYRAPVSLLPALLEAARARTDLRPEALTLAGPRALWLAGLNPDWKFALRGAARDAALPETDNPDAIRRLWQEGLFAERVALLSAVRRRDPAAALELLGSTWPTERAEDRLMFLDSLRTGLSPADEAFLEQALSDRSRNVRATAAELLSSLPGSALGARMAARAASCVALDRVGLNRIGLDGLGVDGVGVGTADPDTAHGVPLIVVKAPHECDAAMQRDGVVPKPPAGRGDRAWWLGQLVEAAALSTWTERFDRVPAEIVTLPVADDWRAELHAAWCRAAVRQRDVAWSRALLGLPATASAATVGWASLSERAMLLSALPPDERAAWVAEFIAAHGLPEAFQILGVCAVPWAEPLGRAVVDALDIARDAGSYPWSFSGVMGLAERCLDPAQANRLEVLTAIPDEAEGASPGAGGYWAEAFQRLVGTLRLRAAMLRELEGLPEPDPASETPCA
ncbi:DUF5691 domain-containing protein [Streptomyces sp. KR80]|uniref:DUF5691 domain-containing protein n=1 Tax=Streptomyces sp. KR80 TaxID=3457426 RepID=UPI003FD3D7DE